MFIIRKVFTVIIVLMFTISCFLGCKDKTEHLNANIIEQPIKATDFSLQSLSNDTMSLGDFTGKFVVLHIAATWCPFCNAEAPHLEQLYQDYKSKNVAVLLIDVKEPKELVQEKLKDKYNLSFPVLLDLDGNMAASYAPKDVLPDLARDEVMLASNIIIDTDGNIQFMSLLDSKNFDAELKELRTHLDELL